ncbi:MAG: methyltransferase domain-containing protein [Candidatus Glassbacteria bacterium]
MTGQVQLKAPAVNKKIVALHFSARAGDYDKYAALQREIAWQLVEWAGTEALEFTGAPSVLEIGCGTGFLTGFLTGRIAAGFYLAVDIAGGMLDVLRGKLDGNPRGVRLVQADGERLPFEGRLFDLVASSTTFQWFGAPAESIGSLAGLLRPSGRLVFATLGRNTFRELKQAYVYSAGRMGIRLAAGRLGPPLADRSEIEGWLQQAGLDEIRLEVRTKLEYFADTLEFMRSIKKRGASNPNFRPMHPATERALLDNLIRFYDRRFRTDGRVYATHEVIFASCRKK